MTTPQELQKLLGTESGTAWLIFMDHVKTELSQVLKSGKPKRSDIENSIIGQNGFFGWKEMVEAPTDQGGLGWNYSTFDMWKRAYSVVLNFPFLRTQEELTPSLINTLWRETKPDFPNTPEELEKYMCDRVSKQRDRQQNSLKDAQKRVEDLEQQLAAKETQLATLRVEVAQIEDLKASNAELNKSIGVLAEKLNTSQKEASQNISELQKEQKRHKITSRKLKDAQKGFWERLREKLPF
jgi:uncharacterized protein YoxC